MIKRGIMTAMVAGILFSGDLMADKPKCSDLRNVLIDELATNAFENRETARKKLEDIGKLLEKYDIVYSFSVETTNRNEFTVYYSERKYGKVKSFTMPYFKYSL